MWGLSSPKYSSLDFLESLGIYLQITKLFLFDILDQDLVSNLLAWLLIHCFLLMQVVNTAQIISFKLD